MMKKELAKKKSVLKHDSLLRWRWALFLFLFGLFVSGIGYSFYHYKQSSGTSPWLSSTFSHLERWIAERKQHWQQGRMRDDTSKTKRFVTNKSNAPPPIHFEFYTALPNMQVTVPNPVLEAKNTTLAPVARPQAQAKKMAVVSAEELEQELSEQIKRRRT
jgi:hypothetical protein